MDKKICCAMLGHSAARFGFGWDEEAEDCERLKETILRELEKLHNVNGTAQFMTACDPCVGLWCAELVNALRETCEKIQLLCIIPYEEQAAKWSPAMRDRYFEMLRRCTYSSAISKRKIPGAQLTAYRCIIEQSDILLAVYDSASARGDDTDKAMDYARALRRPAVLIHPDTFEVKRVGFG